MKEKLLFFLFLFVLGGILFYPENEQNNKHSLSLAIFKPFDNDSLKLKNTYISKKGYDCFIFEIDTVRLIITNKKPIPFEREQDFDFRFIGKSGKNLLFRSEASTYVDKKCKLIMTKNYIQLKS